MLLLNNSDVAGLVSMRDIVDRIEVGFRDLASGRTIQRPRTDIYVPTSSKESYYRWGSVEGAMDGILASRLKSDVITWRKNADGTLNENKYAVQPGTYCGLILLFSSDTGEPLAIMNDGLLQHVRVGASAGVGARMLSRVDAQTVGMIGSGGMARSYLEAFCAVRPIRLARVFSRSAENRESYAREMSQKLGIEVQPVDTPEAAASGADILSFCTDSVSPLLRKEWLEPGMHVTHLTRAEIPADAMPAFDIVVHQGEDGLPVAESARFKRFIGQSPGAYLGGTLEDLERLPAPYHPGQRRADAADAVDVLNGTAPARTRADQITYYRNSGNNGVQFAAAAGMIYRRAMAAGIGHTLPTEYFIQDIRN
jgi:ornithine cyclodeaminase/alanine dehydrogenase-like protein (mu-crystallin family)